MKKFTIALIVCVIAVTGTVQAQYNRRYEPQQKQQKDNSRFRGKYRNLSFASQSMTIDGTSGVLKKGIGGAFVSGRTYTLHKKPVAGMIRFGIDATWTDLQYTNYRYNEAMTAILGGKAQIHQLTYSLGVGPSVNVNPISQLWVHLYFRYAPTLGFMFQSAGDELNIYYGFNNYFVGGGAVSWGVISLGAEAHWGGGNYTIIGGGDEGFQTSKAKIKTNGYRVFVSFRF